MGLSWQQGPLAPGAIGRFLVPEPLPERLLYIEPLRRRMRVRFGLVSGTVIYGPEPLEKPANGNLLVCCSQPIRDVVIDL
jgi:hypothetical protein